MPTVEKPKRVTNLPIGTVRVRPNHTRPEKTHREIKIAMTGRRKWSTWGRWWWLKNRGPIAAGMRVLHRDGDTMNDDPSNLVLGTAADQAYLNHSADPEMSARNYRLAAIATTKMNRRRAAEYRRENWLERAWYPVDHDRKVIIIAPCRARWSVYDAGGFSIPRPDGFGTAKFNGEGVDAAALGWAGRPVLQALVLAALAVAKGRDVTSALMFERIALMRRHRSMRPLMGRLATYSVMVGLRREGLIESRRGATSLYRITAAGLAARGPHTALSPMRGRVIRDEWSGRVAGLLAGYRRECPDDVKPIRALTNRIREQLLAEGGAA